MSNILDNCLRAIQRADNPRIRALNIFISDCFQVAASQAKKVQEQTPTKQPKSYINGNIATVKDNFCTNFAPTTCGSRMLENYRPIFNATVVKRIIAAEAVVLGKTNMDEFGCGAVSSSYFGCVKNPWNILNKIDISNDSNDFYVAGGSSGGSAASVALDIADLLEVKF
jgi:aspartyl-tRNA(Asn)/glutamyl-tRNA(Gln) amidotransferase subunit A